MSTTPAFAHDMPPARHAGEAARQPAAQSPAGDRQHERLLHLFRRTLKAGQVNPLLHMVPRYRDISS